MYIQIHIYIYVWVCREKRLYDMPELHPAYLLRYNVRVDAQSRKFMFTDFPTPDCCKSAALAFLKHTRKLVATFESYRGQATSQSLSGLFIYIYTYVYIYIFIYVCLKGTGRRV